MSDPMNPGRTTWENERDAQYQAIVERIQRNNSVLPTSSLYESRIAPSIIDSTQRTFNALSSQRFYGGSTSNSNSINHFPAETNTNAAPSSYPSSNISEFRMPLTTKEFSDWMENKSIIEQFVNGMGAFDKSNYKLVRRFVVQSFRTFQENQTAVPPATPSAMLDRIYNLLKASFYSNNHTVRSVSGSSLMSDRTVNFHQQPRMPSRNNVPQLSTSNVTTTQNPQLGNTLSVNTTATAVSQGQSRAPSRRPKSDISSVLEESAVCLFDNSMLQHQRDERAARHQPPPPVDSFAVPKTKTARAKPTPRPKLNASRATKPSAEYSKKGDISNAQKGKRLNLDINVKNTPLPAGYKAMSRTGRFIKSPVKFYKVPNETTVDNSILGMKSKQSQEGDSMDNILNESMTLRNKKVVDRKITPPLRKGKGSKNNTPLSTLLENDDFVSVTKKPAAKKPAAKKPSNKENKENLNATKSTAIKKQTSSGKNNSSSKSSKETTSKTKKAESVSQVKEKASKKPTKKRKSAGDDETISKKKKTKEVQKQGNLFEDTDSDDELLGITYRKTTQSTLTVVSPSAGMLSVKKAAAGSLCKETPPCKSLAAIMNTSGRSAVSSASTAKEVPVSKPSQVVKRITKAMQKGQKKTDAKRSGPNKREKKDDPELKVMLVDAIKSSYPMTTPSTAIKYTNMMFGEKSASDDSDFDSGDDGDADDDDDLL